MKPFAYLAMSILLFPSAACGADEPGADELGNLYLFSANAPQPFGKTATDRKLTFFRKIACRRSVASDSDRLTCMVEASLDGRPAKDDFVVVVPGKTGEWRTAQEVRLADLAAIEILSKSAKQ